MGISASVDIDVNQAEELLVDMWEIVRPCHEILEFSPENLLRDEPQHVGQSSECVPVLGCDPIPSSSGPAGRPVLAMADTIIEYRL